jgi:hypothetical protein
MTQYSLFLAKHIASIEDYEISCWRRSYNLPDNIISREENTRRQFETLHERIGKLIPSDLSYEMSIEKHQEYAKKIHRATYCRPWKKLQVFHQREKLREYLQELKYDKKISISVRNKNRDSLIEELLNTNDKYITYDISQGKIIDILNLVKKNGIYQLKA